MKKITASIPQLVKIFLSSAILILVSNSDGALLVNLPFDEGTGTTTTDTALGLIGNFGAQQTTNDYVELSTNSPSGLTGDGSIQTFGAGFLLADDSVGPVMNITNGPLTLEAWVFLPPVGNANAGVVAYGDSYKMGIKGSRQIFTLFGKVDITNSTSGFLPDSQWVHLAAAWEPGVGVHFYINGTEYFEANTNAPARTPLHNYLSIASEGFGNPLSGALDRVRIHNALLSNLEIDSDAATPKSTYASTKVAYNFNEVSFPCDSAVSPSRPTIASSVLLPSVTRPIWTNDAPTGLPGDFAISFNASDPAIKERISVDYGTNIINLGEGTTNYALEAWVKLPPRLINNREVIFRTSGNAPLVSLSVNNNRTLHTTLFGNTDFTSTVKIPNDNRWHHIAIVMQDFARVHFYLDGNFGSTFTRTATAAATSNTNSPSLLIGMESEARYFHGLLDRVRIHNNTLTNSTLDFPAIAGLPRVTAQPTNVLASAGSNVTFSATVTSGTTYQWLFRTNLLDVASVPVAGATSTTLTLTNITAANQGFYSLQISNGIGMTESHRARLTVRTKPGTLQPIWKILPGERSYITPRGANAGTTDLERGMGYNPVTDHLLIGARFNSQVAIKGIFILRASDGVEVGQLPNPGIVSGGTIWLTRVVAAEDGAIYACNFGSFPTGTGELLKIYRWGNETAQPTVAYEGNPVTGTGVANQQWGKNMAVRGSGTNTQILMDTRNNFLSLLTTTDGENFSATLLRPDARNGDWDLGLAWYNDTFWGKTTLEPFQQWQLALPSTPPLQRMHFDFPNDAFGNFSFNSNLQYLGGFSVQAGPDQIELWDVSDINRQPVLVDTTFFTADNAQTVNYGNVLFGATNRVFALNPNNGLSAFQIVGPRLGVRLVGGNVVLFWNVLETEFILEGSDSLTTPNWQTVAHAPSGNENQAVVQPSGAHKFYRLKK